jgi:hypothetical protein
VIGPVYPIAEPSLLALIQSQAARPAPPSGGLERLQRESQARIRAQIEEPAPVPASPAPRRARSFHFDPSIEVPYADQRRRGPPDRGAGHAREPAGRGVAVARRCFFFDARDADQVERAPPRARRRTAAR